jgi:histidinol-phosphatase (PHP family)
LFFNAVALPFSVVYSKKGAEVQIDRKSDFHIHTRFSDGSGSVDDIARAAIEKGLRQITITDHMPMPFATRYAVAEESVTLLRTEIVQAQANYAGVLQINMGLEIEFISDHQSWISSLVEHSWEYLIVSIHHLPGKDSLHLVNGTREEFDCLLRQLDFNSRTLCERYYLTLQEAALTGWFDIVGHLDVVKKHNVDNEFFNESSQWYRSIVLETLDIIKAQSMTMEVNMGGFNHPVAEQYPSSWIIREAAARNIPIVLSSDSHTPETLGQYFNRIEEIMAPK